MRGKAEGRNPKAKRRRKSVSASGWSGIVWRFIRGIVDIRSPSWGLFSGFGFRPSAFLGHLASLALVASSAGCRRDMFQQPYSKPLAASDFFQDDRMASRPLIAHTVARGHLEADQAFYTGKIGTNLVDTFP